LDIDKLRSQTKEQAPPPPRESRSLLVPILAVVAVVSLLVAAVLLYATRQRVVGSDAHDVATAWIKTHQVIEAKLGDDLSFGFMPRGIIEEDQATLYYRLTGSDASGSVTLQVVLRDGDWVVTDATLKTAEGSLVLEMERDGEAGPDPQSEHHVLRGAGLINTGRVSEALKELELAVLADPHNPNAWYWRGRAWQEAGDADKALADFDKALELDPDLAGPHHGVGMVHVGKGEFEAALPHLDKYLELAPEDGMAWLDRGNAHFKLGDEGAARADASRSCELGFEPGCMALEKLGGAPSPAPEGTE
jgi:tetratricopeptide (TPR) repeat protein